MSLATRHMIDKVTFWTESGYDPNDPYANQSYSAPQTISCEYMTGGSMQRDTEGVEFQPSTSIYSVVQIPFNAYVVYGASTDAAPPSNAEKVRKTGFGTGLRGQITEYEAFTG
ncbi:MAG: hypothetical protein Unbinned4466contig1000_7 [Prokaryotic dsDNA virus sp.]|mgnify:CR=1 FL=1|nr:MAG: hypothetical protein Unbinned4466contig1000_7 [Prokaryotic dsDNA virus sp.]